MSEATMPIALSCGMDVTVTDSVESMLYRQLGSSELQVSEISLGSWMTYGGGVGRARSEACVTAAFDVGINFIDTANVYSGGRAEEFLGEVLADRPRDSYVLATKLYFPMPDGDRGLSRQQVLKQMDASLARLRTDYVDLYQAHRYDWDTPRAERGINGGADGGRARRQGALPRLQRMAGREDPRSARAAGSGEVRVEPAA